MQTNLPPHPCRKLTREQVRTIRTERLEALRGLPIKEYLPYNHPCTISSLAKRYQLSESTICYLLAGRTYKDVN